MSKPGPEARLLRAALDFVLRRKRDPSLPPKPPSEWWLSTKPYRKPFVYTFLLAGLGTTDFVVTGFNTRALELSRRKIFIMEQFLERLEKEKLFASGGGGGGEGHEEEGSLSRTEVNLALYGLGLDEIEGGEDEVAAEAGMIEEERRRKERRVMLERERRRKEGQSKEEETTVQAETLEDRVKQWTSFLAEGDSTSEAKWGDWKTRVHQTVPKRPIELVKEPEDRRKWATQFL